MAPELAQGKGYNLSNDVWALVSTDGPALILARCIYDCMVVCCRVASMCIWLYGRVLQGCVLAETMLLEVPFPAKVSGSVVGQGGF